MKIARKISASSEPNVDDKRAECISYIKSAINCLAAKSNLDDVERESIANLSVVIFDLQS